MQRMTMSEEHEDTLGELPGSGPAPLIDMSMITRGSRSGPNSISETSATVNLLASEVGSVLHEPKDAFQRSITFADPNKKDRKQRALSGNNNANSDDGAAENENTGEREWTLTFIDPPSRPSRRFIRSDSFNRKQPKLIVERVGGIITQSNIRPGDELLSINGKKIGPSYSAEQAMALLDECMEEDGFLSVCVGNDEGEDILVQATIIKPRPDLTYEDMGMIVWKWGVLCIKNMEKDSLFKQSVLKSGDHLISINDIVCDKMTPEGFAHVLNELPSEVHILVRRGKQRWSGKFG